MRTSNLWKSIGPGLIWAAAAIGVSHLVQSTRAGATFGFGLVWAVLVANLLKYPFFEFGPRYAAATGESLIEGYRKLGKWAVILFTILTISTMFTIMAAVTIVTGSLSTQLFSASLSPLHYSFIIVAVCILILIPGRYPLLDRLVKVIVVILTISSIVAVLMALTGQKTVAAEFTAPPLWNVAGISFIVALIGWMPSAIDISVWHSLWTLERAKQTGHKPSVHEALVDFNIGYVGTALIALLFLTLGALVMYGTGESFSGSGPSFASQIINLYSQTLGEWSRPVIIIAAFTTMFSTTLTVLDAFPRVMRRLTTTLFPQLASKEGQSGDTLYWVWMLIVAVGGLLLLTLLRAGLTVMVDIATTLSFLTAPLLGYLNYRVVTGPSMPMEARPRPWLRTLSWLGILFGIIFGAVFLAWRFVLA
ncbi:Nramp family divalent metal transporter [bacterium]|nr:Nramp family divalent metal transporter [bacterium]